MGRIKTGLLTTLPLLLTVTVRAQSSTLAIGGTGPSPYFQTALDKIADALTSDGVKVKMLSGEAKSRTALLDEMKKPGYSDLLYITLHNPRDNPADSSRGDIVAQCFVDGNKVWEEKSKSPWFLSISKDHEIDSMLNGILKKIGKRTGGPCITK